jgi:response regulator of citrate/malate metabolism
MSTRSDVLLESLTKFYTESENSRKLHDILMTKTHGVSLRNLEWFVTNYAKNKHVTYTGPTGRPFTVHVAYKSSLDGYSKKLFDPFCRTERIQFQGLTTTVAQLNFIKFAIVNGIIDYMLKDKIRPQSPP